MLRARIIGSGTCLPPITVTNEDLAAFLPAPSGDAWTPAWVERRLGILTRRSSFDYRTATLIPGYLDGDMALRAAEAAIADAGIPAGEIDRVVYATSTPEELMPDPACVLHGRLGLSPDASAIGLTAVGCGGFIYALDMADSDIRAGKARTVLVVGAISFGPYAAAVAANPDPEERRRHMLLNLANAYIFGEGAGAMVLQATEGEAGILQTYVGAWHPGNPVTFAAGGSRRPATHATVQAGLHRFAMDVRLVRQEGPRHFRRAVEMVLALAGIDLKDVRHAIFHQVNARMLHRLADDLGIPADKLVVHVDRYANLDTATLPVAFDEARRAGRIRPGDLVLFAAIGAGWQYGGAIVRV